MNRGFSFAAVVLSYFLVAGGIFSAMLLNTQLRLEGEYVLYGLIAAGAFVGGFIAGRASRGQTILEPAIGTIAVVASIAGLAINTPLGKLLWSVAANHPVVVGDTKLADVNVSVLKIGAQLGGAGVVGALLGAAISEKVFGESTRSSVPWLLYTAFAAFGACLLSILLVSIGYYGGMASAHSDNALGAAILIGIGIGCLLSGLAVGASARTRPLFAAFLGAGAGVAGFFALLMRATGNTAQDDQSKLILGFAAFSAGGAIVAVLGTWLGWVAIGRRAEAPAAAPAGR